MVKVFEFIKKWWKELLMGASALIGFFFFKKNQKLEADLAHAEYDKTDAVLASKQEDLHKTEEDIKKEAEAKKSEVLSHEEMVEELKKL